jgi:ATP synthase protein I
LKKPGSPKNSKKMESKFSPHSDLGFAYRVGLEFLSGILVGLLLGYTVDHIFGAPPWGLVVMVILGAAAGILNIFRMLGFGGFPFPKAGAPKSGKIGEKKDG